MADTRMKTSEIANISRNRRQASMLLTEVALDRTKSAEHTCADSEKLVQHCQETYQRSNELRTTLKDVTLPRVKTPRRHK